MAKRELSLQQSQVNEIIEELSQRAIFATPARSHAPHHSSSASQLPPNSQSAQTHQQNSFLPQRSASPPQRQFHDHSTSAAHKNTTNNTKIDGSPHQNNFFVPQVIAISPATSRLFPSTEKQLPVADNRQRHALVAADREKSYPFPLQSSQERQNHRSPPLMNRSVVADKTPLPENQSSTYDEEYKEEFPHYHHPRHSAAHYSQPQHNQQHKKRKEFMSSSLLRESINSILSSSQNSLSLTASQQLVLNNSNLTSSSAAQQPQQHGNPQEHLLRIYPEMISPKLTKKLISKVMKKKNQEIDHLNHSFQSNSTS
jgi:hypothetical protein